MTRASTLAAVVSTVSLFLAPAAVSEELQLRPRFDPGDAYRLSLRVTTETDASSKGPNGESIQEEVRLQYKASVVVLEVDAAQRPIRERHRGVSLTFERPGESGSLFTEPVTLDVVRKDGLEIQLGSKRVDSRIERTITELLEKQFEFTLEPALLEPGRAVEVGDSWQPDESLTRRFLQSRGIRVIDFAEGAVATLRRQTRENGGSELVIDYDIPISRLELTQMPPNSEATRSEARLSGQVQLATDPGKAPPSSTSNLTLELNGLSRASVQSMPWNIRSSTRVEKASEATQDLAASGTEAR